jgi:ferredoxin, 2Fe-2S
MASRLIFSSMFLFESDNLSYLAVIKLIVLGSMSIVNNAKIARIVISNWAEKRLEVKDFSKSLLRHLHDHQLDWMHSCGGKGRCTTCKAIILSGGENLSQVTPAEERYRQLGALQADERLSCQARVTGDVTIAVPEEYKLPHIDYSRE